MPAHAIVGAQWGDEGKGKLVDYIAARYDTVARFQGGNNAGHTVKVGRTTYKLHLLPSGAVRGRRVVIGNGVVVDPRALLSELATLEKGGKRVRLEVSDRAHVILPYHVQLDGARESVAGRPIGTTRRGIGPCYADKASRTGIRMGDLVDPARFRRRLRDVVPDKRRELELAGSPPDAADVDAIVAEYGPLAKRLRPYVADVGHRLSTRLSRGAHVLFEGAQGVLLDVDHGTYPYVTSSSTVASNATAGTGVAAYHLEAVLGVAKAYATRVGEGPFPTEIPTDAGIGHRVLTVGREFGTTTGRPRRVGWLDLVALAYAVRTGGITHLAVTKLDVLDGISRLKVCTAYRLGGRRIASFPADAEDLARVEPAWRTLPGWLHAASGRAGGRRLDPAVRSFLRFVEQQVGVPVALASVGPARDETIVLRRGPFAAARPRR